MGRNAAIFVVSVFVGPLLVGVLAPLLTPWLQEHAAVVAPIVTAWWVPWLLYCVLGLAWLYYWFVIVARRIAPEARLQRINDLFKEQVALRAAAGPNTNATPPWGMMRRVDRFRKNVGRVIGSDPIYRDWLDACVQFDAVLADPTNERAWRSAIMSMAWQSDEILRDLQLRLSPIAPPSPQPSRRDR